MRLRCHALLFLITLVLVACTSTDSPRLTLPQRSVELVSVPFHPQQRFHCGPAALLTVLEASGVTASYEAVVERVYVPQLQGTLQAELLAASRGFERLPYVIAEDSEQLFALVEAGQPVLVLQNLGITRLPVWHYAVVIGFDGVNGRVILRSGTNERLDLSLRQFLREWRRAGAWAMVLLSPGDLPAPLSRAGLVDAAADFDGVGSATARVAVWQSILARWPDTPIAHVGIGNASYALGDQLAAAAAFAQGLELAPDYWPARLNLAAIQSKQEQPCAAVATLRAQPMASNHPLAARHAELLAAATHRCRSPGQGAWGLP